MKLANDLPLGRYLLTHQKSPDKQSIPRFRYAILHVLLALTVASSLSFAEQANSREKVGSTSQKLVQNNYTVLWTKNGNLVPMCWHQLLQFPSMAAENEAKAFVAQTIQDGWINRLNLKVSWINCPTSGGEKHVRVKLRIGDSGYNGTTLTAGMATLTTPADRVPPHDPPGLLMGARADWNQTDQTRANFRSLILHEFGHILGFEHEQYRSDGPQGVPCYSNPLPDAIKIGPPDPQSIMGWSYCKETLGVLTLADIRGARAVYGRRDILIRGVLLAGKFRMQHELNRMSAEDQRNTLITELAGRTNQSGAHFQSLDDAALAGTGAVLVFLREAKLRTDLELKNMSDDDQRNTLIVEINAQTQLGSRLQGFSNTDLVLRGLGDEDSNVSLHQPAFIRGVLLAGKFRTQHELNRMSAEDQRNTLITELAGRTNQSGGHFQSLDDYALAGTGAVLVLLREAKLRTDQELKKMSDDDQRNTLIVEIAGQTSLGSQLQGLSNMSLVRMAFGVVP